MSLEAIQSEVSTWTPEMLRRLQGYLVSLMHQKDGTIERLAAKLDDPDATRWVSLEEAERRLGLTDQDSCEP